jgi:hypothetical protein
LRSKLVPLEVPLTQRALQALRLLVFLLEAAAAGEAGRLLLALRVLAVLEFGVGVEEGVGRL